MKKIYSLIAMAAFALAANAEITTDVSTFKNYMYLSVDGDVKAGEDNTFYLNIVHDGAGQSIGCDKISFPAGYEIKKFVAVKDIWAQDPDTEEYYLTLKPATISGNTCKIGILGGGAASNYTAKEGKIAKFTVAVPANADAVCNATMEGAEVSVLESYQAAQGLPYNYEKHDVAMTFNVTGTDAIETVAADGTEVTAPAKKVVDGQLVIETANGTFTAAGAQVK